MSSISLLELLDNQIARGTFCLDAQQLEIDPDTRQCSSLAPQLRNRPGQLKHSPRCENLTAFNLRNEVANQGSSVRPPWTPPPSPSPYGKESATETHAVGLAAEKSISNGRR